MQQQSNTHAPRSKFKSHKAPQFIQFADDNSTAHDRHFSHKAELLQQNLNASNTMFMLKSQ